MRSLRYPLVTVLLSLSSSALAGGYYTARFGASEGNVTGTGVFAAYYNPAGLAMGHGTRVSIEGTIGYRTASFDRDPAAIDNVLAPGDTGPGTPQANVDANSGEASLTNLVAVPFIGVATDFGVRNLGVALSFEVPFGGQADWKKNSKYAGNATFPGAVDGPQRWGNITGEIRSAYVTAAAAYKFEPVHLAVGVGLNLVLNSVSTLRGRNPTGTDDLVVQPSNSLVEGRSWIDASGTTFSIGAGLMWEPMEGLVAAVSYQSQPGFGEHTMSGTLENQFSGGARTSGDVDFQENLPDVTRVGAAYRVSEPLVIDAEFTMQRWSVLKKHCVLDATVSDRSCDIDADGNLTADSKGVAAVIPRFWKDSYDVAVGAHFTLSPRIVLHGAFTVATEATVDRSYDPSFIDMLKLIPVVGGTFELTPMITVVAHWTQVIYMTRDVPVSAPYAGPSRVPSEAGTYKQSVGIFQLEAQLHF